MLRLGCDGVLCTGRRDAPLAPVRFSGGPRPPGRWRRGRQRHPGRSFGGRCVEVHRAVKHQRGPGLGGLGAAPSAHCSHGRGQGPCWLLGSSCGPSHASRWGKSLRARMVVVGGWLFCVGMALGRAPVSCVMCTLVHVGPCCGDARSNKPWSATCTPALRRDAKSGSRSCTSTSTAPCRGTSAACSWPRYALYYALHARRRGRGGHHHDGHECRDVS